MNQQPREWNIFGHVLTTSDLSISILMFVALLSGVAGIWLGPLVNVLLVACFAAIAVLVWRTTLKHKVIRIALFVIEAFIGLSAIQGGIALLRGAFDQWVPVAWLAGTPFSDYTIPGLVLVIVVGGSALLVVSLDSKVGNVLPMMLVPQLLYFVLGLAVFGLAGSLWMREYRSQHFHTRHASHA